MNFGTRIFTVGTILSVCLLSGSAHSQEHGGVGPHLFANQYTQGFANQATAQMYISPVPVPAWVGHTYYTYEPLYPHELTYWHTHRYHSYYDGGRGLNRTRVHYYGSPIKDFIVGAHKQLSIPRP
jgi:hypothetical protein